MTSIIHDFSGCYPLTDRDPFIIESCPHVYFVGNQDRYETRLIKGISYLRIDAEYCWLYNSNRVLFVAFNDDQIIQDQKGS